jgi:hypothetical protein
LSMISFRLMTLPRLITGLLQRLAVIRKYMLWLLRKLLPKFMAVTKLLNLANLIRRSWHYAASQVILFSTIKWLQKSSGNIYWKRLSQIKCASLQLTPQLWAWQNK